MLCETHRRRQPAGSTLMAPRGAGTTASAAPSRSRSGRGGAGRRGGGGGGPPRGGGGPRPWGGEPHVREDLPDDGGIVQRGDQPEPAPTVPARQNVNGERPV